MKRKIRNIVGAIVLLMGYAVLLDTDAYYAPYLLGIVAAVATGIYNICEKNEYAKLSRVEKVLTVVFSLLFALMISAANYRVWLTGFENGLFRVMCGAVNLIAVFGAVFISFFNIFVFLDYKKECLTFSGAVSFQKSRRYFAATFAVITIIDVAVLLLAKYPGLMTYDSVNQLNQIFAGEYSNHHPFYHTLIIKLFMNLGMALFGNIYAAVATYMVFQILFMAFCMALAVKTEADCGAPAWFVVLSIVGYAILPVHIMLSITMWKDVMFAGFVLLYVIFAFRSLRSLGKETVNLVALFASAVGVALFRSNGFYALLVSFAVIFFVLWFKKKAITFTVLGALVLGFLLKGPLLAMLDIPQPTILESIAVPLQQVSRVISCNRELDDRSAELIERIADTGKIAAAYSDGCVDPIKAVIVENGTVDFLTDNIGEYLKLYVSLGLKYPGDYLLAWIDETRGVYDGGYPEYRWTTYIWGNDYGLEVRAKSKAAEDILEADYLWFFDHNAFAVLFVCEGVYVWLLLVAFYMALVRKNTDATLVMVLPIAIVATLVIATPMSASLRYLYSIICVCPLVTAMSVAKQAKQEE